MKFKLLNLLILIFVFSFLLFPFITSAVDWLPLVPCGRTGQTPCTRCDFFRLADNVIHFFLEGIVPPVAAVLFIAAGLMIVLAGANPGLYAKGIAIFKNTFWGLVIILASWLIVNTFIQSFGPDKAKGSWFRFICKEEVITPGGPVVPPGQPPAGQINACTQCSAYPGGITAGGQPVQCTGLYINTNQPLNSSVKTCSFADVLTAQNLARLRQINGNWVLSEGFPPTVTHADACHSNGSCVDIALSHWPSNTSQLIQQLNELCNAAVQAGFPRSKIVNEYSFLASFWPAGPTACPAPTNTRYQTGDNLHLIR